MQGCASDSPVSIPIQPEHPRPADFQVAHAERGGRVETSISRVWRIEDARRCRLCDRCTATVVPGLGAAHCLKVHDGFVSEADAPLFRDAADLRVVGGQPRAGSVA